MKTFVIKSSVKARLDLILREKIPLLLKREISNSKLRRLIIAGKVSVNGKQIYVPSFEVYRDSDIEVKIDEEKLFFNKQPDDIDFTLEKKDVLYEDEFLIAVNKPENLPVEETIVEGRKNLHQAVVDYLFECQKSTAPNAKNPPYAGIVHRLDRTTSGVILFSKKRTVNKALHDVFETHSVKKAYIAVVCGRPERSCFSVDFSLGRISPRSQAAKWGEVSEVKGGLASKTDFEIVSNFTVSGGTVKSNLFLLNCFPKTGRTHQIRAHLAGVSLPILGDTLYGGIEYKRIMLHAKCLEIKHPVSGELLKIEAPLPEDFKAP